MMGHFAAMEALLGQRTTAVLSNATMTFAALSIDGVLDKADALPQLGGGLVAGKQLMFVFETALLGATPLAAEATVTITKGGTTKTYKVATRTDLDTIGQTALELKRATV